MVRTITAGKHLEKMKEYAIWAEKQERKIRGETLARSCNIENIASEIIVVCLLPGERDKQLKIIETFFNPGRINFRNKIGILNELLKKYHVAIPNLSDVLGKLNKVRDYRNIIAHHSIHLDMTIPFKDITKEKKVIRLINGTNKQHIIIKEWRQKMKEWKILHKELIEILHKVQEENNIKFEDKNFLKYFSLKEL